MKNIRNFKASKYAAPLYCEVEPDIYRCNEKYVTSLCFEQEPELEEGASAADISQYPLEDVLDLFTVYVSDFYNELNRADSQSCHIEFCGNNIEAVQQLRSIIGKHVYNQGTGKAIDLVIE